MPQVVSANRLTDGTVVFLAGDGRWVEGLQQARVLADIPATEGALAAAARDAAANRVVEVAAFEVMEQGGQLRPTHIRDAIRAAGPTVRRDHGKQALGL